MIASLYQVTLGNRFMIAAKTLTIRSMLGPRAVIVQLTLDEEFEAEAAGSVTKLHARQPRAETCKKATNCANLFLHSGVEPELLFNL